MALAWCNSGLKLPDTMEFPAHLVWIEVVSHESVVTFFGVELVVVVRNVHFFFSNELPVIAIWVPDEAMYLIKIVSPRCYKIGCVITDSGSTPHSALAYQILPSLSWFLHIDTVMRHKRLTRFKRWLVGQKAQQRILSRPFISTAVLVVIRVLPIFDATAC
ncbi:hypothetical protein D3C81_1725710 [compost metagenome]